MEDGIRVFSLGQRLDRFVRRENHQFDFPAASLGFHLVHYRKRAIVSRAYYEAFALPGYLLLDRDRSVSELPPEFLRGLLLALANLAPLDNYIVLVRNAVNGD